MRILFWLGLLGAAAAQEPKRVAAIDFFGYGGLDVDAVRRELPFREGDPLPSDAKSAARETVRRVTGLDATDVAMVCCEESGGWMIYIGLRGSTAFVPRFSEAPKGKERLPPELTKLDAEIDEAWVAAVKRGNAREEQSTGYALSTDPELRSLQVNLRDLALRYEKRVYAVLERSGDGAQRAIAATVLGYARQTAAQVRALARAASDPHGEVRNNAVRALGVLAEGRPDMRRLIPASVFVTLVRSGVWSDRNKGTFLLRSLTEGRAPAMLAELRSQAWEALVEVARWKTPGHAQAAWVLLGRMGGLPEGEISRLMEAGDLGAILGHGR